MADTVSPRAAVHQEIRTRGPGKRGSDRRGEVAGTDEEVVLSL